ncbi:hypothetical protein B0G73_12029 [Paraburkholderia sp. BL25I1N1]|nr:hypothetical protein B0G73_12029 [Paraburkholderia sp. BL25I1N1]
MESLAAAPDLKSSGRVRLASCQMHLATGFFCEGWRARIVCLSGGIAKAGRAGSACGRQESSTCGKRKGETPSAAHGKKYPPRAACTSDTARKRFFYTYGFTVASLAGAAAALPPLPLPR